MPGAGDIRRDMEQLFQVGEHAVIVDLTLDDDRDEVKPSLQPQRMVKNSDRGGARPGSQPPRHVVKQSDSGDEAKPSQRSVPRKRRAVLDSDDEDDVKPGQQFPPANRVKTEHEPDKKSSSRLPSSGNIKRIMRPETVVPTITDPDQKPFKHIVKLTEHQTVPNTSNAPFDLERLCSVNLECVGDDGRLVVHCTQCNSMEFKSIQWPAKKPRVPAVGGHTFRSLHAWVYHELRPHHHFEFSIPQKIDIITHTLLCADGLLPVVAREWSSKFGTVNIAQVTNELRHIQRTKTLTPRFRRWVDKASTQSRMNKDGHDEYPSIDYDGYSDNKYKKTG